MIKNFWLSNKDVWFSGEYNLEYIKFFDLYDVRDSSLSSMDLIILFDQISRHVFNTKNHGSHVIEFYLQEALKILNTKSDDWFNNLTDDEWCFAMLPYRHSMLLENIYMVMEKSWKAIEYRNIANFIKATYQRCPMSIQNMIYYKNNDSDDINVNVLSLSGGVDSMVCSKLYGPFKTAIFINYMNRDTHEYEERFVVEWCMKEKINLYIRRIKEIKRNDCMKYGLRDLYEQYTKNVRFSCYKQVMDMNCAKYIYLGHNRDDMLENIFTNIANKSHFGNLKGMSETVFIDGICFKRPMLHISKYDIYKYAHENDIPHLPCSTPKWSQRGKIREIVIPNINKWNPNYISGIEFLAETCQVINDVLMEATTQYVDSVNKNGFIGLKGDQLIWKKVFFWKGFFEKLGRGIPSTKSLNCFIENIIKKNEKMIDFNFELKKDMKASVKYRDNMIIIYL